MGRVVPDCEFFDIEEFAVSASRPDLVEPVPARLRSNVARLVSGSLCPLRRRVGRLDVLSGYRSDALNRAVGGSKTSQHRRAEASDVTCADPEALFRTAMQMAAAGEITPGQVIYYPAQGFVHIATPSARYPKASFHVHDPRRGHQYAAVENEQALTAMLA